GSHDITRLLAANHQILMRGKTARKDRLDREIFRPLAPDVGGRLKTCLIESRQAVSARGYRVAEARLWYQTGLRKKMLSVRIRGNIAISFVPSSHPRKPRRLHVFG